MPRTTAREIQDPFGFDENDLNIQGYENVLIDDIDTVVDGRLRLDNVDGMEAPGNEELTAEYKSTPVDAPRCACACALG